MLDTEGVLRVLDFGGSLGSSYFQHRNFLSHIENIKWIVVEQSHFVAVGKREFENEYLKFSYTIEDAVNTYQPNIILFSSVLQYLPQPFTQIETAFKYKIPYLWIDRTPFKASEKDQITQQIVIPSIVKASYPCWLFSEKRFRENIEKYYTIKTTFDSLDKINVLNCPYKGIFCYIK